MNLSRYDLVIQVDYVAENVAISASEDMPLPIQGDWDAFLINIENILYENGFGIAEQHASNRQNSLSQYYGVYPANKDKTVVYRLLIILRVSDHPLTRGEEHGRHYYENYARKLKNPKTKQYQNWRLAQVIVQGHSTEDYWDALREFEKLVQKWSKEAGCETLY